MTNLTPNMQIVSGLILSIGSLFFIILLFISYFSKERFLSVRNKLYQYLLVTVVFLLITEIIASLYFAYPKHIKILYIILLKIHWSTGIIWPTLLYFYSYCFLNDITAEGVKNLIRTNKRCKVLFILAVIAMVVFILLPISYNSFNTFTYIPGITTFFVVGYCASVVIAIVLFMIIRCKTAPIRKKITTIIMIFEAIFIFGFQVIYNDIAFIGLGATLQMFLLYFNIENPDIKIVKELETVKNDIERSNKTKSDFLFNMSQEIRTPMNSIIGFSQTIINNPNFDAEATKNDIKNIVMVSNNLLDIINNILDISKIESGKESLNQKEYYISNVLKELSIIMNKRIGKKPVQFILNIDNQIPSVLYGDVTKLHQSLLNILLNAIKYTETGKIALSVSGNIKDDIVILSFKISDTGYGIKKEDYDKLFEKFSRLDDAVDNEIGGTGLGLVITKKYLNLMNGSIRFDSEFGVGTTFYVDLPQKIINRQPIGDITTTTQFIVSDIDCSNYNVLIVDDNKLNLKVAQRLLSKYKFKTETVSSGKECIYKVKSGVHYDMIFMDHMMPEMDGIQVLHILRKLEDYELPPIVALTANAINGMKEMYLKEGFDEYLSKPINISELDGLVNKYFNK